MAVRRRWRLNFDPNAPLDEFERAGVLADGNVVRGVRLPAGAAAWHDVDRGHLEARPPEGVTVDVFGRPLHAAKISFPPTGDLFWRVVSRVLAGLVVPPVAVEIVLGASACIDGHDLPEGAEVGFDAHGALREVFVPGGACVAGLDGPCLLTLRRDGAVQSAQLYAPAVVQGWPCRGDGSLEALIEFHPGGQLRRFVLDTAVARDGVQLPRGARVGLTASGRVERHAPSERRLPPD